MMRSHTGFTLLEAITTTIVLGIIGAVTLPLISSTTDVYAASSSATRVVDDLTFALDRVVSVLREAPPGEEMGTIAVTVGEADEVRFSDGTGCRLVDGTLLLRFADGSEGEVAVGVDSFVLRYIAADGSDTSADAGATQRFEVELSGGGLVLRTVAFCRSRYGT